MDSVIVFAVIAIAISNVIVFVSFCVSENEKWFSKLNVNIFTLKIWMPHTILSGLATSSSVRSGFCSRNISRASLSIHESQLVKSSKWKCFQSFLEFESDICGNVNPIFAQSTSWPVPCGAVPWVVTIVEEQLFSSGNVSGGKTILLFAIEILLNFYRG